MLLTCTDCGKTLKIPDSAAGKRARCPSCLTILDVPAAAVSPAERAPRLPPAASNSGTGTSPQDPPQHTASQQRAASADSGSPGARRPAAPRNVDGRSERSDNGNTHRPVRPAAPRARPRTRPPTRPPATAAPDVEIYDDYENDGLEDQVFQDGSLGDGYFEQHDQYDANPFAAPVSGRDTGRSVRKRPGRDAGGRTAGTGLLVQGWSTVAIFLTMVMIALTLVGMGASGPTRGTAPTAMLAVAGTGGLVILLAAIGVLIGECMCVSIPERSGAKGLIVGAICCLSLQIVMSVLQNMLTPGGGVIGLSLLSGLAALAHMILFELFLRAAARYVGRNDLERQALIVLIGLPACMLIMILTTLIGPLFAAAAGSGAGVIGILMLITVLCVGIAMIVLAVMHVALLFRIGSALRG